MSESKQSQTKYCSLNVIAGSTRNPCPKHAWIPDVETPDPIRGRHDRVNSIGVKP